MIVKSDSLQYVQFIRPNAAEKPNITQNTEW